MGMVRCVLLCHTSLGSLDEQGSLVSSLKQMRIKKYLLIILSIRTENE